MSPVEVFRRHPPDVQRCKGKGCALLIEWVVTAAHGRRMPVTAPLVVVRELDRGPGTVPLTVIDGATVHFNTCPAADTFRRRPRPARTPTRGGPTQGSLFGERDR